MSYRTNRRTFLKHATYAGAVLPLAMPRLTRAASANEKVNLAFVGTQGQAGFSIDHLRGENIVAIADVDANHVAARLENLKNDPNNPHQPNAYADYRRMLDREQKNIDAVVVATPDHQHASPSLIAMEMGKHVYCEKPLAHTIQEARLMIESARRNNVATQMGTQIHAGDNYRRVVEAIRANVIGPVREVHVILYGGSYSGGRFGETPDAVPDHLDWDLWLGAAAERDYYSNLYHPFQWRGWWDFGGGGLSDLGCHFMDLPHWALNLGHPVSAKATGPDPMPLRTPRALMAEYRHAATADRPEVTVTWHHGGTHIDIINVFEKYNFSNDDWRGNAILFVGDDGLLISDYGRHKLLPEDKFADYQPPAREIESSPGHHAEWIAACKGGKPALCNFDYSGKLTESVLLGLVSHRAGNVDIDFDADAVQVTNNDAANEFITKSYRKGWNVDDLV
ncbi:MAG: Gfo/Idh/MocA family oxidoreductase [Phycisphaeraceae bacterium]